MINKCYLFTCLLLLFLAKANSQTWYQKAYFPGQARYNAVGFSIGNKGYIGLGINSLLTEFDDFWEWDQASNTWSQIADFPGIARDEAAGFSIGSKGYVVTGDTSKALWEWDGDTASPAYNTWIRKADFPGIGRRHAVAFSIGNKGYVGTGSYQSDFWEWDGDTASPAYNTWTRKADFGGGPRGWATGFSIGKKGYIGTGTDGSYIKADFWEWEGDTASPNYNTWTRKADIPNGGRENAIGFSIINYGYVGLGLDSSTMVLLKDFWQWNPLNNTWSQKPDYIGTTRQGTVGFSIGNKGYIGTGSNSNIVATKDFWEYCDTLCNVGTNELSNSKSINVYPNPFVNELYILSPFPQGENFEVALLDVQGRWVHKEVYKANTNTYVLYLQELPSGVYILRLSNDKERFYKKVLKGI